MGWFDTVINDFRRKKDDLVSSRFNVVNQARSAIALAKPNIQQGWQRVQQTPKREFFMPTSQWGSQALQRVPTAKFAPQLKSVRDITPKNIGLNLAQGALNIPIRSTQALGRIGQDIRQNTTTAPRLIGNLAGIAETPLTFGTFGTGAVVKQVLKEGGKGAIKLAIKQGAKTGAKYGAGFGLLSGLEENREAPNVFSQFLRSTPQVAGGAVLGGVLGGGVAGAGALFNKAVQKLTSRGVPEKQAKQLVKSYWRNKAESKIGLQVRDINKDKAAEGRLYDATAKELTPIAKKYSNFQDFYYDRAVTKKVSNRLGGRQGLENFFNEVKGKSVAQPPLSDVKLPIKKIEPQVKALEVKSPILKATGTPRIPVTKKVPDVNVILPKDQANVSSPNIIQPRSTRGGITPPKVDFTKWKDGETLSLSRETLERNIEGIAKKDAPIIKQFIVDPVRSNETQRIQYVTQAKKEVQDNIIKRLDIKAGSKEDALIQRFGEGNMTAEELRASTSKWQQVMEASQYFREKYDDLLNQVNQVRQQFGYNPIPKRQDYFRHFQEINDTISQFGLILREQDIPTEISGLTSIFKPGKPFSTAELQRKGGKYTESAIKGMDNYLDSISKQIYHIDSVQRARSLETYIRDAAKEGKADLPSFVANIREYGNLVSGKKGTFDRAFESVFGRKIFGLSRFLTKRTSANLVGGNISSALTNFIPFTQAIATTSKPAMIRGILEGLTSPFMKDISKIGEMRSNFLIRRFGDKGPIAPTLMQKGGEFANYVFKTVDQFSAKSIVSGKYYQALSEGKTPQQAIKIADEYAGKVLADRSLGNLPNLFGQRTLGPVTQFQVEINNMYSFLKKDIPNISNGNALKIANALGQFAILSYVYNNVFEKISGRRPTLDPIQAGLTFAGLTDEGQGDIGERLMVAGKDIGQNLPFSGILAGGGRIPISAGIPDIPGLIKGETTFGKEVLKPLSTLLPPFGGGQVKKTFQGLSAYQEGVSTTPTGRIRFNVEQTPGNLAKTAIFGQFSTEAGQKYIKNLGKSKSEILYNDFKKLKTQEERAQLWNQYVKEGKITKENLSDIKKQIKDDQGKIKNNEERIRSLPIQDGSRVRAILKEFNKLDTSQEKAELWDRYVKLGIITKDVAKQLKGKL